MKFSLNKSANQVNCYFVSKGIKNKMVESSRSSTHKSF